MKIPKWLGYTLWKLKFNVVRVIDDADIYGWTQNAKGCTMHYTPKKWHYEIIK